MKKKTVIYGLIVVGILRGLFLISGKKSICENRNGIMLKIYSIPSCQI